MNPDLTTYRACYYQSKDGQGEVVLTGPEHAHLSDDQLTAIAVAEAYRADIVSKDGDDSRISEEALMAGLRIGDWAEA